jgi:hypothetical protein
VKEMDKKKYWRNFNIWFWTIYFVPVISAVSLYLADKALKPEVCGYVETFSLHDCSNTSISWLVSISSLSIVLIVLAPVISAYYSRKIIGSMLYFYISLGVLLCQAANFFLEMHSATFDPFFPLSSTDLLNLIFVSQSLAIAFIGYLFFNHRYSSSKS